MLPDLQKIISELQSNVIPTDPAECTLPNQFKFSFGKLAPDGVECHWYDYTAYLKTDKHHLGVICPNQWFYLAAYAVPLYAALIEYQEPFKKIFKNVKDKTTLAKEVREDVLSNEYDDMINKYYQDAPNDAASFKQWLTNYDSWYGKKTVERSDFAISAILNIYGLSNDYQTFIPKLVEKLHNNPDVLSVLLAHLKQSPPASFALNFATLYPRKGAPSPLDFRDKRADEIKSKGENVIIYGAPGTGKSWKAGSGDDGFRIQTVFHTDTTYQDFVGSYRPCKIKDKFSYEYIPGPFIKAVVMAQNNPQQLCTLVIDEINRANAGAVFGEMFQLLDRNEHGESDYYITPEHSLAEFLKKHTAFMDNKLWLPANLNIRATMNSADQGVFPLDSAFKRRWNFNYLPIDFSTAVHKDEKLSYAGKRITWEKLATTINTRLASHHINEDRHLGPYFLKSKELKANDTAASKLLNYLWDDVVRHQRRILFKDECKTFSDVMSAFKQGKEIFSTWDHPITDHLTD
ncbi:McrB family protein [Halodesulfovibrio aestuarii]|uniref:McrB family protein n=1 Tax=Halodesulfovibrio aestuarii TaxID=126333 RepID=UPI003D336823